MEKIVEFLSKMKNVSNIAAVVALMVVLVSFVLNSAKITAIPIDDAIKVGIFVKGVFLTVDASVWIDHFTGKKNA